jgi:hypothetical protein
MVALLAHNADAAVIVSSVVAYPAGFSVSVVSITRRWDVRRHRPPLGAESSEMLRFGMRFADGSKVTNMEEPFGRWQPPGESRGQGRRLHRGGGGGGGRKFTSGYWCEPLPPPGPMAFVCEWPVHDIGVTEYEIDASLIIEAAERAYPIWPDDIGLPEPARQPGAGPRPWSVSRTSGVTTTAEARKLPD